MPRQTNAAPEWQAVSWGWLSRELMEACPLKGPVRQPSLPSQDGNNEYSLSSATTVFITRQEEADLTTFTPQSNPHYGLSQAVATADISKYSIDENLFLAFVYTQDHQSRSAMYGTTH